MSKKLTRKKSFHRVQLFEDCWLYSSCTLLSNFFYRYDLKENYKSLFENDDCEFTKKQKFTNFNYFVEEENLHEMLRLYSNWANCHSEIYYHFLFFFFYFIGMKTNNMDKFKKGKQTMIFVDNLINNLKYHLYFYKEKFLKYLLNKIKDTPSSPDSYHSPYIVDAIDSPDIDYDSEDEMIGGNPYLTTHKLAKMLLPSWFSSRSSPQHSVHLTPRESLFFIIDKIYVLIQQYFLFQDIQIHNLTHEIDISKIQNILENSYLLSSYSSYNDPEKKEIYYYPCYKEDMTSDEKQFVIVNSHHVFTMEEFVGSKKEWSIIVKDSNSLCRGRIDKEQFKKFHFTSFLYVSSTNYTCDISSPFHFETNSYLKDIIEKINPSFFTTSYSPEQIQPLLQPIIEYLYNKKQYKFYLKLLCHENTVTIQLNKYKYRHPIFSRTELTEEFVGEGRKKNKTTSIYDKKVKKKRVFSNKTKKR